MEHFFYIIKQNLLHAINFVCFLITILKTLKQNYRKVYFLSDFLCRNVLNNGLRIARAQMKSTFVTKKKKTKLYAFKVCKACARLRTVPTNTEVFLRGL